MKWRTEQIRNVALLGLGGSGFRQRFGQLGLAPVAPNGGKGKHCEDGVLHLTSTAGDFRRRERVAREQDQRHPAFACRGHPLVLVSAPSP